MAFIATLQVLVDEPTEEEARENLEALFESARVTSMEQQEDARHWLVDWVFDEIIAAGDDVDDALTDDTYEEGDAFESLDD